MEPLNREGNVDRPRSAGGKQSGRVIVIGPYLRMRRGDAEAQAHDVVRDSEARLEEATGLARAIDLTVADTLIAPISQIRPATYLGKGKVEEITGLIAGHDIELVVMDCALSPIQQRNLEKAWNTKVLDRTGLILEIFGRRAKTKEGALQVELAHLNYQRSRLVRSWTHLERQRGGFGFMGGPGETQIEADRRLIGDRITRLENELKKVQATRRLHRAGRQRVPYRVVALVGYTNAGKSTLFNRLTRADVQAADMLFATLDPTLRALSLPHGGKAMLSDTVGFISNLPTQLVAAFRATLEEVLEADIILHVRDISHEDAEAQERDVDTVLRQLGIDPDSGAGILEVWNKIDRFDPEERENLRNIAARRPPERPCFLVSAVSGEGVNELLTAIEDRLAATRTTLDLSIDASDGAGISWLHRNAEVLNKELHDGRFDMTVRVDETKRDIVVSRFDAVPHVACMIVSSSLPSQGPIATGARDRSNSTLTFCPDRRAADASREVPKSIDHAVWVPAFAGTTDSSFMFFFSFFLFFLFSHLFSLRLFLFFTFFGCASTSFSLFFSSFSWFPLRLPLHFFYFLRLPGVICSGIADGERSGMRRCMKFLHTMGAIGLMGAMACLLVLLA